jgi:hypothetical protein
VGQGPGLGHVGGKMAFGHRVCEWLLESKQSCKTEFRPSKGRCPPQKAHHRGVRAKLWVIFVCDANTTMFDDVEAEGRVG